MASLRKAGRAARTWKRKAYRALKRIKAPTPVAKAGANNVGKAAYRITAKSGRRRSYRRTRSFGRRSFRRSRRSMRY